MPSISDLGKSADPRELSDYARDSAATAAMLRMQSEELARISSVLSPNFSAKLELPRTPVHEVIVETPHIVRVMQAQAAEAEVEAQIQVEAANHPRWKRWGFWRAFVASVGGVVLFGIAVWTFYVEILSK